ncbi:MAG TPA: IS3 family transposase [Rectinema sp.]|nr:IS3 family transposase [Rectinema sp.]HPN92246.1 IS3 family transposase [Rectinema sp.]HQC17208.1 IS3 family transposase [Rectinema sp.]HQL85487.1 IS3 family transposase [Rectinema sp.]
MACANRKARADALKYEHPLKSLLEGVSLSRSSYYYQRWAMSLGDKYAVLKNRILELFEQNNRCYGYRRIHESLVREGIRVSDKVIRTIMKEACLVAQQKAGGSRGSYQGEITPAPENLIEQDFHAEAPNKKWLTDITEFHIPAGKAYLSPIVDCFDGMLVSWSISTRPDAELVNTMLDLGPICLMMMNLQSSIPTVDAITVGQDGLNGPRMLHWYDRCQRKAIHRTMLPAKVCLAGLKTKCSITGTGSG